MEEREKWSNCIIRAVAVLPFQLSSVVVFASFALHVDSASAEEICWFSLRSRMSMSSSVSRVDIWQWVVSLSALMEFPFLVW